MVGVTDFLQMPFQFSKIGLRKTDAQSDDVVSRGWRHSLPTKRNMYSFFETEGVGTLSRCKGTQGKCQGQEVVNEKFHDKERLVGKVTKIVFAPQDLALLYVDKIIRLQVRWLTLRTLSQFSARGHSKSRCRKSTPISVPYKLITIQILELVVFITRSHPEDERTPFIASFQDDFKTEEGKTPLEEDQVQQRAIFSKLVGETKQFGEGSDKGMYTILMEDNG